MTRVPRVLLGYARGTLVVVVLTRQLCPGIRRILLASRLLTRKMLVLFLKVVGVVLDVVEASDVGVGGMLISWFSMVWVSWQFVSGRVSFSVRSRV